MTAEPDKVNILLVDDEPKNLAAFEAVLEGSDRNMVKASSGEEALRCLLKAEFAVILLDVRMPGLDGFETAKLIREHKKTKDTPIIFLTAFNQGEIFVSKGYSLGAVDYIFKPADPVILKSKVGVFVELYKKTEQVKRQAALLSEATAFLNNILESATEYAIIALDLSGKILSWNEGARRNYGHFSEEMVGRQNARVLFTAEDLATGIIDELFNAAEQSGKVEELLEGLRKNGQRFPAAVTISVRHDIDENRIGFVLIAKDITERKQAEEAQAQKAINEQLQHLDKVKNEFLSFVSHEVRSALTGIIGYADMMHRKNLSSEMTKEYAARISKSGRRLSHMLTEMLDLDRMESGQIKLGLDAIDLNAIIEEVVNGIKPTETNHSITLQLDPAIPPLSGDQDKLARVMTNLLSNAIKYSPQGGSIVITTFAEEQFAHVSVEDQGIGIPPDALEKVFDRYARIESPASQRIGGTGLGLAIVKQIVKLHGGTVWAESALDKGSIFHFTIPYAMEALEVELTK